MKSPTSTLTPVAMPVSKVVRINSKAAPRIRHVPTMEPSARRRVRLPRCLALLSLGERDATRRSNVASLARALAIVARPRYLDKAEESREGTAEDLDVHIEETPSGTLSGPRAANAWRILGGVRGTWIDDPGARFEKGGTAVRGSREGARKGEKKAARSNLPIAFFFSRVYGRDCLRFCVWWWCVCMCILARVCVYVWVGLCACVSTDGTSHSRPSRRDAQCEQRAPWYRSK